MRKEEYMKEKVLIIRHSEKDYFFQSVARKYNIAATYSSNLECKYFKALMSVKMDYPLLLFGWKHHIREYDKIIIFDYGWSKEITSFIKKYNPKCKVHLFFFNTISNSYHQMILKDKNIDKLWSFDQKDVEKYGLNFNTPMYAKEYVDCFPIIEFPENDIIFVGKAKERISLIENIEEKCKEKQLKTDFTIVKSEKDYVAYEDYVRRIMNAKCILDITNEGQTGLTLRFMEALFTNKKIITNNQYIKAYAFYDPANIFVIKNDDIEGIDKFLRCPGKDISKENIDYYDLENWIKRFI